MGTRPEFLIQSLTSIRLAGDASIHVVAPKNACLETQIPSNLFDLLIDDPGIGLSSAIDFGLRSFPLSVEYINWLGDDDLLKQGSLDVTMQALRDDHKVVLAFGGCDYINSENQVIFTNKSGKYAVPLMRVGPQLIPHHFGDILNFGPKMAQNVPKMAKNWPKSVPKWWNCRVLRCQILYKNAFSMLRQKKRFWAKNFFFIF
jgi:hypothetical protein